MTYLVLDLETTDSEYYKRKGNPFYNKILTIGIKSKEECKSFTKDEFYFKCSINKGYPFLGIDLLIGHNIKYDLLYLWKWKHIQEFFKNGGRIWDTQLAEYILSGQQHKYPALRDIAVNKYNCPEREKKIETHYSNGLNTSKMPIEDLLWDVKNDVIDTEQVYLQQKKIAQETWFINLIESQMDGLLSTIGMEFNGIKINKNILNQNKKELINKLEFNKKELYSLIQEYWK